MIPNPRGTMMEDWNVEKKERHAHFFSIAELRKKNVLNLRFTRVHKFENFEDAERRKTSYFFLVRPYTNLPQQHLCHALRKTAFGFLRLS